MASVPPGEVNLQTTDLTNCDKEQIHIPGSIQAFGALVAFDADLKITRVSANLAAMLNLPAAHALIGQPLNLVLRNQDIENLLNPTMGGGWHIIRCQLQSGPAVNGLLHDSGHEYFVDLIPAGLDDIEGGTSALLLDFVARASKVDSVQNLSELLARSIRAISKFDRVKIYRFDADWNGEVIAEAKDSKVPSYLGLHFPQGDIPKQARELYQRNKVRVISDVDGPKVPLIDEGELPPLDMSFSYVRSVSEIHLQYLRNMGVCASMSLSIFNGDKFWGLVACHHYSPRVFTFNEAALYEALSDVSSGRLLDLDKVEQAEVEAESLRKVQDIIKNVAGTGKLSTLLQGRIKMQDLIESTAAIVVLDGNVSKTGAAPDDQTINKLIGWLDRGRENIVAFDDLPGRFSEEIGAYACGLLAARLSDRPKSWLMWLRFEVTREVHWAGDPYKPAEETPFGLRLYPRTSFEIWKEVKRGTSTPWQTWERETAKTLSQLISKFVENNQIS